MSDADASAPNLRVVAPQARCRAGVARRDITPPVGIYHRMWGAATHERAEGVHRPLLGAVLWLAPLTPINDTASAPAQQVLVTIDHCILETDEYQRLRQAIAIAAQVPISDISLTLSHTHAAGLMSRSRADRPGGELIGPYLDRLAGQLAALALEARKTLAPASIVFGQGRCSLAANRDLWDEAAGRFVCGYSPQGPADDTLVVGRITDDAGAVRAVLVNYACHPTTLAWQNRAISSDWVGAMRETIETVCGGVCVFLQGSSGDLGPRDGFIGDPAVADCNGRQVAYAALAALEALPVAETQLVYSGPVVSGAWIGTWRYEALKETAKNQQAVWLWEEHTVELPYRLDLPSLEDTERGLKRFTALEREAAAAGDALAARDNRSKVEQMNRQLWRLRSLPPGRSYPFAVTIGLVGDALWVLVPGELYQHFQTTLRHRFAPRPVIVATLTNDTQPGYLPTLSKYGTGVYPDLIASVAPGALEHLTEHTTRLLQVLLHKSKTPRSARASRPHDLQSQA